MVAITHLPHRQTDRVGVRGGVNIKDRFEDRGWDVKVRSAQCLLILKIEHLFRSLR